ASRITSEMTTPRTGRSMKNFAMSDGSAPRSGRVLSRRLLRLPVAWRGACGSRTVPLDLTRTAVHASGLGRHLRSRADALQSVNDQSFSPIQPVGNDAQPVVQRAQRNGAVDNFILFVQDVNEF